MKILQTEITRTDNYHFYVDEEIWTPEKLREWSNHFYEVEDIKELIEHLSYQLMRKGLDQFYEGFGYVRRYWEGHGKQLVKQHKFTDRFMLVEDKDYCEGISYFAISVEDDFDYDTKIEQL